MKESQITYLERNSETGSLEEAGSENLEGQYVIGNLYIVVNSRSAKLPDTVPVKSCYGTNVVYDVLVRVRANVYELRRTEGRLAEGRAARFRAGKRLTVGNSLVARRLYELDPDLLDSLEAEFGYNVLGESRLPDDDPEGDSLRR